MTTSHPNRRRRGAILLVVLAMLALFAVIGLSFVLFAESEGTAGRIYREDKSRLTPLDPADAAGRAIRQVVWGTDDVNSVMPAATTWPRSCTANSARCRTTASA